MKFRSALPLLVAAACGGGTTSAPPATAPSAPPPVAPAPVAPPAPADTQLPPLASTKPVTNKSLQAVGLDAAAMDRSVDPCDDFYQFACGGYIKNTVIPDDKAQAMRSFVAIGDKNLEYLHGILDTAATNPGKDQLLQKVGAFYGACLDEAKVEKLGTKPIQPWLAQIKGIHDTASLTAVVAMLHANGFQALFNAGSTQDSADATKMVAGIDQAASACPSASTT